MGTGRGKGNREWRKGLEKRHGEQDRQRYWASNNRTGHKGPGDRQQDWTKEWLNSGHGLESLESSLN